MPDFRQPVSMIAARLVLAGLAGLLAVPVAAAGEADVVGVEMRRDGAALDPLSIRLPPGDPVPTSDWGRWVLESRERLGLLEALPGPPILRAAERGMFVS